MSSPQQQPNPFVANAPAPKNTRLPWVVAVVFAVVAGVLFGIVLQQQAELTRLRGETPASAPTTSSPQNPGMQLPEAQTDPEVVKRLDALPRRQANDPLAMGKPDAPVVMVVWTDFRCPFCSKWERETLPALKPYVDSGSLRIEHRDLVLFGEDSERTAIGARAAGQQGKFWEFASKVAEAAPLSGHPGIDDTAVRKFAEKAGVADLTKFEADLGDAAHRTAIGADTSEAKSLGISGTPFFVINHTPINGALPTEVFTAVIEQYGGKK